jgi:hypothetical protein
VRELIFALDADATGQAQWRALARQAALRGKRVAGLPAAAYGGCKDVSAAWTAGVLTIDAWSTDVAPGDEEITGSADWRETCEERLAIMMYDGHLPYATAAGLAWAVLPERTSAKRET